MKVRLRFSFLQEHGNIVEFLSSPVNAEVPSYLIAATIITK